ncbi:sigma-70 family RNA polymerase sigma factor [Rhizobium sp. CECT 9324]|uniref:sigma-70 family RNA polymerase sigma factor n=1 Tax=Rhizobium sp. CECT 9324 TaxID=2845820 RepID=UPI000DDFF08F|nr:sigma-70 family RNA polymerase sigma factor [Rhizobium sp. CECT 9324]CAH0338450.1 ECF RNA polymerase sigma factor EcfG [Rhizobium sp. CECT 9324]
MSIRRAELAAQSDVVDLIPALRAFARTFCQKPEEADDLVQETLMRALANLDKFEPGTRLKSWLFTIMRNTFCTRIKKSSRESVGLPEALTATLVTEASQDWVVQADEVRRALERLPAHHREILVLIVMLGERYEDAAVICGCAVGTIKSRLNRAREQLKRELGETAASQ